MPPGIGYGQRRKPFGMPQMSQPFFQPTPQQVGRFANGVFNGVQRVFGGGRPTPQPMTLPNRSVAPIDEIGNRPQGSTFNNIMDSIGAQNQAFNNWASTYNGPPQGGINNLVRHWQQLGRPGYTPQSQATGGVPPATMPTPPGPQFPGGGVPPARMPVLDLTQPANNATPRPSMYQRAKPASFGYNQFTGPGMLAGQVAGAMGGGVPTGATRTTDYAPSRPGNIGAPPQARPPQFPNGLSIHGQPGQGFTTDFVTGEGWIGETEIPKGHIPPHPVSGGRETSFRENFAGPQADALRQMQAQRNAYEAMRNEATMPRASGALYGSGFTAGERPGGTFVPDENYRQGLARQRDFNRSDAPAALDPGRFGSIMAPDLDPLPTQGAAQAEVNQRIAEFNRRRAETGSVREAINSMGGPPASRPGGVIPNQRDQAIARAARGFGQPPPDMTEMEQRRFQTQQGAAEAARSVPPGFPSAIGRLPPDQRDAAIANRRRHFGAPSLGGAAGGAGTTPPRPSYTPGQAPTGSVADRTNAFVQFTEANPDFVAALNIDPARANLNQVMDAYGGLDNPSPEDDTTFKGLLDARAAADKDFRAELDKILADDYQAPSSTYMRTPYIDRIRELYGKGPAKAAPPDGRSPWGGRAIPPSMPYFPPR